MNSLILSLLILTIFGAVIVTNACCPYPAFARSITVWTKPPNNIPERLFNCNKEVYINCGADPKDYPNVGIWGNATDEEVRPTVHIKSPGMVGINITCDSETNLWKTDKFDGLFRVFGCLFQSHGGIWISG
uniref:Chemokine vCXCL1 n=1 Tax=Caenorhabditis tropicalis TaxID=1561998 RepID=A0A1I7TF70_9PELO